MLSYIFVLHQTTTGFSIIPRAASLSYIFVLHQTTTIQLHVVDVNLLSYIFVLHQTTTVFGLCIVPSSCLISLFYIKPQPAVGATMQAPVVLYLCSTSNHNSPGMSSTRPIVVLYLCSTSNHNHGRARMVGRGLSYIFVLHQTTTNRWFNRELARCLISLFYIKPQPADIYRAFLLVVLYLCSTSNHNLISYSLFIIKLSYIFVLHQTTTYTLYPTCIQLFTRNSTYMKWPRNLLLTANILKKFQL